MKISVSILTTTVLLVVAASGVPGALADQSIVASDIGTLFNTTQPSNDEKASWAPIRALEANGSPQQQGQQDNGKPKQVHQNDGKNDAKQAPRVLVKTDFHRALVQAPVATPASTTTGHTKATPAPIKPKVTPCDTTSKATPAPTKPKTVAPCHPAPKPKATATATKSKTPALTKAKPQPTPCPTKPAPNVTKSNATTSTISDAQQKT
ncbi:hypothetical protein PI124_g4070 [Phytophthora idaei]|nr:hypothetical protein PI125_g2012 [Phytophthora idaei]KAG3168492.1 hypothetical protein PI126_g3257 [Phytophthora idaei]KAG3251314.1 hypothetical protein PI124_g4070 [Phytophthora idaei]